MNKLFLFVNTVKYLRWKQIIYRVLRMFPRVKVREPTGFIIPDNPENWKHIELYNEKINSDFTADFLNFKKNLAFPTDWNDKYPSKLWLYNLHYFEDLLCKGSRDKQDFHLLLVKKWVEDNPKGQTVGWEPYPTSLRIVNILKAWLGGLPISNNDFVSIFHQSDYLSNDLEKHLMGNHYFVNLKALLFAGAIFNNNKWLHIAEQGLLEEIPEQILEDGAYFELSPMYHALILVDMLDILNLCNSYQNAISKKLRDLVLIKIPKMFNFLDAMSHPDGDLSFFNDSTNGIAPSRSTILEYANKLQIDRHKKGLIADDEEILNLAGYFSVEKNFNKLIFDAADIGASYIPGHAHADTLSFEFSIGTERVFVNSGIDQYGTSEDRLYQRGTSAHNTIELNGKNSSEVWSGFRVAARASVLSSSGHVNEDNLVVLKGSHNGYKTLFGGAVHQRTIELSDTTICLKDEIKGNFKVAVFRLFIHPNLNAKLDDGLLLVEGKNFKLISEKCEMKILLRDSTWFAEFGKKLPNKVLEIYFTNPKHSISFAWEKFNNENIASD